MQVKYVFIVRIIRAEDEKKGIDSPSKVSLISKESELHHSIRSLIGGLTRRKKGGAAGNGTQGLWLKPLVLCH